MKSKAAKYLTVSLVYSAIFACNNDSHFRDKPWERPDKFRKAELVSHPRDLSGMDKRFLADYEIQDHCQGVKDFLDYYLREYAADLTIKVEQECEKEASDLWYVVSVINDSSHRFLRVTGFLGFKEGALTATYDFGISQDGVFYQLSNVKSAWDDGFHEALPDMVATFNEFTSKPVTESKIYGVTQEEFAQTWIDYFATHPVPFTFMYRQKGVLKFQDVMTTLIMEPGTSRLSGTVRFPDDLAASLPIEYDTPKERKKSTYGILGCMTLDCLNSTEDPMRFQFEGLRFIVGQPNGDKFDFGFVYGLTGLPDALSD